MTKFDSIAPTSYTERNYTLCRPSYTILEKEKDCCIRHELRKMRWRHDTLLASTRKRAKTFQSFGRTRQVLHQFPMLTNDCLFLPSLLLFQRHLLETRHCRCADVRNNVCRRCTLGWMMRRSNFIGLFLSLSLITWPAVSQRSLLYFLSGRNKKTKKSFLLLFLSFRLRPVICCCCCRECNIIMPGVAWISLSLYIGV